MLRRPLLTAAFALSFSLAAGCRVKWGRTGPRENITAEEKAAAANVKSSPDPVQKEIDAFRLQMHFKFGERRFDELEKIAEELRGQKTLFGNGGWKIADFYEGLTVSEDVPEAAWAKAESLHQEWIAARPQSLTAHLAYAEFLTMYAWEARGSGFANTVTDTGRRLFIERLQSAREMLEKARTLPGNDPMWWAIALRVGLGQSWSAEEFDAVVKEGLSFEPTFWRLHTLRANSLLTRWYGEPGEWEKYAAHAASLPDGLGAEVYARIIIFMLYYHPGNVFHETRASWPKTREGLAALRKKYPAAKEFASYTALLAGMAQDRTTAKEMFKELGETYFHSVWQNPQRYVHIKNWAETGKW